MVITHEASSLFFNIETKYSNFTNARFSSKTASKLNLSIRRNMVTSLKKLPKSDIRGVIRFCMLKGVMRQYLFLDQIVSGHGKDVIN